MSTSETNGGVLWTDEEVNDAMREAGWVPLAGVREAMEEALSEVEAWDYPNDDTTMSDAAAAHIGARFGLRGPENAEDVDRLIDLAGGET